VLIGAGFVESKRVAVTAVVAGSMMVREGNPIQYLGKSKILPKVIGQNLAMSPRAGLSSRRKKTAIVLRLLSDSRTMKTSQSAGSNSKGLFLGGEAVLRCDRDSYFADQPRKNDVAIPHAPFRCGQHHSVLCTARRA
jgi:hypothetical protein